MERRNEYLKTYKIGLTLNESDINTIKNQLTQLQFDKTIASDSVRKNISDSFAEYKKQLLDVARLQEQLDIVGKLAPTPDTIEAYKEILAMLEEAQSKLPSETVADRLSPKEDYKEAQKEASKFKEMMSNVGRQVAMHFGLSWQQILANAIINVADFFVNSFKGAISTLSNMATYNLSGSYFINSSAREQAMQYGLSDAQNYAFSRTKEFMGIRSDEDLFYMNEQQREQFAERMGYYTSKYEELANEEFFQTWQETQIELKELKEEFVMTIGKFIVDNKDIIVKVLQYALTFMEGVMKALTFISHGFEYQGRSASEKAARMSELLGNNSSVINNTRNANVNMSPIYNVYGGDMTKIQEQQRLEYEQIYAAYNNG